MDEGVELKQLTVGVDSVGLGVGAGLAGAIAVMAISAASVVIVFIILYLFLVVGCVIAGCPLCNPGEISFGGGSSFSHLLLRELRGEVLEGNQTHFSTPPGSFFG